MRKINLLYVITKLELGGAQRQLLSLIARLDRTKFNVFLITAREGLLMPSALSLDSLQVKPSPFLERTINPIKDMLAMFEIYSFIKRNNIDIVHTHSSKAGIIGRLAAALAGCKGVVHTVHGWSFYAAQSSMSRLFYIVLERICARFSHRLIVVSNFDREQGLKRSIGREGQYLLVRYGIDYAEFKHHPRVRERLRQDLGLKPGQLLVGMIGCLKHQKCPEDFLKLAHHLKSSYPDVKFILVGDGVLRGRVERQADELGLGDSLILAGWRRDIPEVLSAMDILVLTSLWEGLPIAVLEAAASAKPALVTDTGGIRDLITEGKTGFLVPLHGVGEAGVKLAALLTDSALRERIGSCAKESLGQDYAVANMAKSTQDLYESLV
jgi:glycosyltransferase involved in cell wall biosynthesis